MDKEKCLDLKKIKISRDKISVYRNLIKDTVIDEFYRLISYMENGDMTIEGFINKYNDFYFVLLNSDNSYFKDYMIEKIIFDENAYSLLKCESLDFVVQNDLKNLLTLSAVSACDIKKYTKSYFKALGQEYCDIEELPAWNTLRENCDNEKDKKYPKHIEDLISLFRQNNNTRELSNALLDFHKRYGTGEFARFKAFTWEEIREEKFLRGIESPDPIELKDLIGYEIKREIIIENTLQFINGFPANNMLLYGDRGTGKSSTVKALLNKYYTDGLRIIEIPKEYLTDFPEIIRILKDRPQKFIIFIDDLTFEDGETGYTALKAVLEGSVEAKPKNVLIYATSNRRHLVKEYFHERRGLTSSDANEEVHASDTIEEKLSLADRFGITVVFSSPTQDEYLEIIEGLVKNRGISIDLEELKRQAIEWERQHNGRSARTARQFVDFLEGKQGLKR